MSRILENKIVTITGAGSGIGRAAAEVFSKEGAYLVLADINKEAVEETAHIIGGTNGKVLTLKADVTNAEDVNNMVNLAVKEFGRLDGAFNNAGISGPPSFLLDYPDEVFEKVVSVNLNSIRLCMKAQIAVMLQQGKGTIVNTASTASFRADPGLSGYVASKHAVIGLTKTAAIEYGGKGIRINAVCPGVIRTPLLNELIKNVDGTEQQFAERHIIGRIGTPEEIGEAAAWALSDRSSFMVGHALIIDGGQSLS